MAELNIMTILTTLFNSLKTKLTTAFPLIDTIEKMANAARDLGKYFLMLRLKAFNLIDDFTGSIDTQLVSIRSHLDSVYGITEALINKAKSFLAMFSKIGNIMDTLIGEYI